MSFARLAAVVTLALPCAAFASNTFNVASSNCTGSLVSSSTNGLSLACTGDFSISDGTIESDISIFLSATGSLTIEDVTLHAPTITITGGSAVDLGTGIAIQPVNGLDGSVVIGTNSGSWATAVPGSGGLVTINAGPVVSPGSLTLTPSSGTVPEPGSLPLVLAGLMAIGTVAARRGAKA